MEGPLALSRAIDRLNEFVGKWVSWLILASILVSSINAVVRKMFNTSSNAWLELQWYLFGAAFLLAAAYTLKQNEHIRIDIVYGMWSRRMQHWIDLLGHIFFLMPFCLLMVYYLVPYVARSVRSGEMSTQAGGLINWPPRPCAGGFTCRRCRAFPRSTRRSPTMRGHIDDPPPIVSRTSRPRSKPRRGRRGPFMIELIAQNMGRSCCLVIVFLLIAPRRLSLAANGLLFIFIGVELARCLTARSTCPASLPPSERFYGGVMANETLLAFPSSPSLASCWSAPACQDLSTRSASSSGRSRRLSTPSSWWGRASRHHRRVAASVIAMGQIRCRYAALRLRPRSPPRSSPPRARWRRSFRRRWC